MMLAHGYDCHDWAGLFDRQQQLRHVVAIESTGRVCCPGGWWEDPVLDKSENAKKKPPVLSSFCLLCLIFVETKKDVLMIQYLNHWGLYWNSTSILVPPKCRFQTRKSEHESFRGFLMILRNSYSVFVANDVAFLRCNIYFFLCMPNVFLLFLLLINHIKAMSSEYRLAMDFSIKIRSWQSFLRLSAGGDQITAEVWRIESSNSSKVEIHLERNETTIIDLSNWVVFKLRLFYCYYIRI